MLEKLTKQDEQANAHLVSGGWKGGKNSKSKEKASSQYFGDPSKLSAKVKLSVYFDKNPADKKVILFTRSEGLKVASSFALRLAAARS